VFWCSNASFIKIHSDAVPQMFPKQPCWSLKIFVFISPICEYMGLVSNDFWTRIALIDIYLYDFVRNQWIWRLQDWSFRLEVAEEGLPFVLRVALHFPGLYQTCKICCWLMVPSMFWTVQS
jgi:hypothetical protein